MPRVDVVEKLARGLKMSPCFLAFGVEVPFAEEEAGVPLRSAKIGERLRVEREHASLSLRQLAEATRPKRSPQDEGEPEPEVSHTTIRLTEDGETIPSVATAEALAQALRISPCWLAFAEGEPRGPRFPVPIKKKKATAPRRRARKSTAAPRDRS